MMKLAMQTADTGKVADMRRTEELVRASIRSGAALRIYFGNIYSSDDMAGGCIVNALRRGPFASMRSVVSATRVNNDTMKIFFEWTVLSIGP